MRNMLAAFAALVLVTGCKTVLPRAIDYTPAQVDVLQGNGFQSVDGNWELGFEEQPLFDTGTAKLAPGRQAMMEKLVRTLLASGIRGGLLEGHTDSVGSEGFNAELSRERAQAVKAAMVAAGMAEPDIRLVALGEGYPVRSNRTAIGRRENRRVVLIVTPTDAVK